MKDLMDGLGEGMKKKRGGRKMMGMKSMEHEAMHGRGARRGPGMKEGMGPEAVVKSSGSDKKMTEEPMDKPEGMEGELSRAHEDHKKRIGAIVKKHMHRGKKAAPKKKSEHKKGPKDAITGEGMKHKKHRIAKKTHKKEAK